MTIDFIVVTPDDAVEFNEVYRTYFTKDFPARAFIGPGPLLRGGRFEMQGIDVWR